MFFQLCFKFVRPTSFGTFCLLLLVGNSLLPVLECAEEAGEANTGLQQVPAFIQEMGGKATEIWNKIKCGIFQATANAAKMMNIKIPENSPLAKLTICSNFAAKGAEPEVPPAPAPPAALVVKGEAVPMIAPTGLDQIKAALAASKVADAGRIPKAMLQSQFSRISISTNKAVDCGKTPELCPKALVMMGNSAAQEVGPSEEGEGEKEEGGAPAAGGEQNKIVVVLLKAGKTVQEKFKSMGRRR